MGYQQRRWEEGEKADRWALPVGESEREEGVGAGISGVGAWMGRLLGRGAGGGFGQA